MEDPTCTGRVYILDGNERHKPRKVSIYCIVISFTVGLAIGLALFFGLYYGLPSETVVKDDVNDEVITVPDNHGVFSKAAVASDAGLCSEIGKSMLIKGGHAVDAAIAAMLCVGLVNMHSTGIGGGSFMTVYDAETDKIVFINSREVAPLAANIDMYDGDAQLSQLGTLAIAVPGEIAGYWEAHQRYGKLKWAELFEPSIKLATEGVTISKALATSIAGSEVHINNDSFNLKPIFTHPNGSLKMEGDVIILTDLANTLRRISEEGANSFYNGSLAQWVVDDIADGPGRSIITLEDLNSYRPEVVDPLSIDLDGRYTVYSPPPTGSGAVLSLIINILDGFNLTKKYMEENPVLTYHRIIESFKLSYAKRSLLGDYKTNKKEIEQLVKNMTSEDFANALRKKISDDKTHNISYYGADFAQPPNDAGTSHLCVLGEDGSAVSLTSTINLWFGSKVRGIRTGILFNNEMDDFSSPNITNAFGVPPSENNFINPGHRPLSSMTPTMVVDKQTKSAQTAIRMIAGASGGTRITTGTAMAIMNYMWFGDSLQESVSKSRLHHQLAPNILFYESGFDQTVLDGLKEKGHDLTPFVSSVVQAISRLDNGSLSAVSDWRKGGYPDGY